ncbi:hypothetical protein [Paraburkholderia hayleyella]|uniref:hypothetical protein n=1 Tax=Paraburkholderia hayleyella TaxID=2152889 RepID=UPI0012918443|nr:hypothetical protein [Paraburkholderia hayleyella]
MSGNHISGFMPKVTGSTPSNTNPPDQVGGNADGPREPRASEQGSNLAPPATPNYLDADTSDSTKRIREEGPDIDPAKKRIREQGSDIAPPVDVSKEINAGGNAYFEVLYTKYMDFLVRVAGMSENQGEIFDSKMIIGGIETDKTISEIMADWTPELRLRFMDKMNSLLESRG